MLVSAGVGWGEANGREGLTWTTCSSSLKTMASRWVSLKPPFLALVKGVRMARVMTTSSGFFCVLSSTVSLGLHGVVDGGARDDLHGVEGALAGGDVAEH